MRSPKMLAFINQLAILLIIFPFQPDGQGIAGLHEKLYRSEKNFSIPGQKCNEEDAEKKLNALVAEYKEFELIPLVKLDVVAKFICVRHENFEVICNGVECKCSKPSHVWDTREKKCSAQHGTPCESGNDCVAGLICSNTVGPPSQRKPDAVYLWQFNRACMIKCIRDRCNRRNVECAWNSDMCKEVIECRADPFDVPFECIAECNRCFNIEDFNDQEICQDNCKTEVKNYKNSIVHKTCDNECRRNSDVTKCTTLCLQHYDFVLFRKVREACPSSSVQETCLYCLSDKFSHTASKLVSDISSTCNVLCEPKNITLCNQNCVFLCALAQSAEYYLNCFSLCEEKVDTEKKVLCHFKCFNKAMRANSDNIIRDCKNLNEQCNVLPDDQCKRCSTICQASIEIQVKMKRKSFFELSLPEECLEECNELVSYSCTACGLEVMKEAESCYKSCNDSSKSTLTECQNHCISSCKNNLANEHEAKVFYFCIDKDIITNCYKVVLENLMNKQSYEESCKEKCSSTSINDCSATCVNICNTTMQENLANYCSGRFCYDQESNCDRCLEQKEIKCQKGCIPSDIKDLAQCKSQCFDLCEAERPFIDPYNDKFKLCGQYCNRPNTSPCTKRCFEYCKVTSQDSKTIGVDVNGTHICGIGVGRCCCSKDRTEVIDVDLPELKTDVCRKCKTNFQSKSLDSCKNDVMKCKPRIEADPDGNVCFTQCHTECMSSFIIIGQSLCENKCRGNSNLKKCEQKCIDDSKAYSHLLTNCFFGCFDHQLSYYYIGTPNICKPEYCVTSCAQKSGYESVRSCEKKSSTECNEIKQPPYLSKFIQSNCPECNLNVRLVNLRQCRDRCTLPDNLVNYMRPLTNEELVIRADLCTSSCYATCFQQRFPELSYTCHNETGCPSTMKPEERLKCIIKCCNDEIVNMTAEACDGPCQSFVSDENLPNMPLRVCPSCAQFCYGADEFFFQAAAELKCSTCKDEVPSECDICKAVLIAPFCSDNECPKATCTTRCIFYCHLGLCVENTVLLHQKTNLTHLEICAKNINPDDPNCKTKCSNDCDKTCKQQCTQVQLLQKVCYGECNTGFKNGTIINPQQSVGFAVRRPLPTRKPGPYNYQEYWCCYNNGNGQCNASNPRNKKNKNTATMSMHFTQLNNKWIYILVSFILVLIQ